MYHKVELLTPDTAFYIEFYGKEPGFVQPPAEVPTVPISTMQNAGDPHTTVDINVPIDASSASHLRDLSADITAAVDGTDQLMTSFWVFQIAILPLALTGLLYVVFSAARRR